MAFKLGNFSFDEILFATGEQNDKLLFTLDQLTNASIEVSAESTDFTDKKGNVWRKSYRAKTGTMSASSAMIHYQILSLASGSAPQFAGVGNPIQMPKFVQIKPGQSVDVSDAKTGSIQMIGVYGDGGNEEAKTAEEIAAMISGDILTAPTKVADGPTSYVVTYERDSEKGVKIINSADEFPSSYKLTLFCSYAPLCNEDGELQAAYVVFPNFQPDPNQTISLDSETQEIDFNGTLNVDYCGDEKTLYIIYIPGEGIKTGVVNP
jgi:hypothetical protein